jgi:hypothetical protein
MNEDTYDEGGGDKRKAMSEGRMAHCRTGAVEATGDWRMAAGG